MEAKRKHRTKCPEFGKEQGKTKSYKVWGEDGMKQIERWDKSEWQFFWTVSKSRVRSQLQIFSSIPILSHRTRNPLVLILIHERNRRTIDFSFKLNLHLIKIQRIGRQDLRKAEEWSPTMFLPKQLCIVENVARAVGLHLNCKGFVTDYTEDYIMHT